jgi:hypothetical protein
VGGIATESMPLAVSICGGCIDAISGSYESFFVSKDNRTFIFDFGLHKWNHEQKEKFYSQDYDAQRKEVCRYIRLFFQRLTTHGLYVWQKKYYTNRDFGAKEINLKLQNHGRCVLMAQEE